jgi:hypothetical protein
MPASARLRPPHGRSPPHAILGLGDHLAGEGIGEAARGTHERRGWVRAGQPTARAQGRLIATVFGWAQGRRAARRNSTGPISEPFGKWPPTRGAELYLFVCGVPVRDSGTLRNTASTLRRHEGEPRHPCMPLIAGRCDLWTTAR